MAIPASARIGPKTKIINPLNKDVWTISRKVGEGGFAAVYEADRKPAFEDGEPRCLKLTDNAAVWHGEAFFGEFLNSSANAVRQIDAFPFMHKTGQKRVRERMYFAIVTELVRRGTVQAWTKQRRPWSEADVLPAITALLVTLNQLHVRGICHRDITPGNVFIGPDHTLKLGDFGIAAMARGGETIEADYYTPAFKPPNVNQRWSEADDLYQVGLLALTLLSGTVVETEVPLREVTRLTERDGVLRPVLRQALLKTVAKRYTDSDAMLADLGG